MVSIYIMTVTYIYHSCFLIELADCSLLFDFYKDAPRGDGSAWIADYLLAKEQDLYVFCTHSHADHFNPLVLTWKKAKGNIHYIFSKELLESGSVKENDALFLKKGELFSDNRLSVKAFGSTDVGGSFLVRYGDKLIFHAGDLNNWHWNEEVSNGEALAFENSYLCELELLSETTDQLHVTMFPVDPRLGQEYMKGAKQFVTRIKIDYFLPMHFGEEYGKANLFEGIAVRHGAVFLSLSHAGQSFTLE
jgi:L-ascorbate metabolism protein UlaG (beta-lactamase superfamily)